MKKNASSTYDKIKWLLKHKSMWEGLKLPDEFHRIEKIALEMKREALYSKNTYIKDIYWSVQKHIRLARVYRREINERSNQTT